MAKEKSKVLILKTHAHSLKAVEVFLRNRELDFYSTSSLKEALAYLLKEKPKFFLMAADHPNKKIRLLPKLIEKTFNTTILGFTESSSNASLFALQELNSEFVLYPPVSGPAIIRTLSRVEKELETKRSVTTITERISRYELTRPEGQGKTHDTSAKTADPMDLVELKSLFLDTEPEVTAISEITEITYIPSTTVKVNKAPRTRTAKQIAQVLQESLENLKNEKPAAQSPVPLTKSSKLSCLVVDAGETKGYLLVAFSDNRPLELKFMENIRHSLMKYFETQGGGASPLASLRPMQINTKEIEFAKWAQGQTEFMMTTEYGETQVVAAFLPNDEIQASLGASADKTMCQVFLDHIEPEKILDFDIYVYLPANNKYVLYGRKGGKIFVDQKLRLAAHGVTHIHMHKEDSNLFYRFQAESFINTNIDTNFDPYAA